MPVAKNFPYVPNRTDSIYCELAFAKANNAGYTFLSFSGKDRYPDYIISINAVRKLTRSTEITVNIDYAPNSVRGYKDPNFIDKTIVEGGQYCYCRWGWSGKQTPLFKCLLKSYTCKFSNDKFSYTLQLVGQAVRFNYNEVTATIEKSKPLEAIKDIFDKSSLGDHYVLDLSEVEGNKGKLQTSFFGTGKTDNPVVLLSKIIQGMYISSNSTSKCKYYIIIDDTTTEGSPSGTTISAKGTISVKKSILGTMSSSTGKLVRFNWGGGISSEKYGNAIVLDWSTDYDGVVFLTTNISMTTGDTKILRKPVANIDVNSGSVEYAKATPLSPDKDGSDWSTSCLSGASKIDNFSKWIDTNVNYPYSGTLVVIGQPYGLQIGDSIEIKAMVGNIEHFSSGYYQVSEITDSISSGNYTTTYKVIKNTFEEQDLKGEDTYVVINGQKMTLDNYFEYKLVQEDAGVEGSETPSEDTPEEDDDD